MSTSSTPASRSRRRLAAAVLGIGGLVASSLTATVASAQVQPGSDVDPAHVRVDGGARGERTVFDDGGYLTGVSRMSPDRVVLDYVGANHDAFGLTAAEADGLQVDRVRTANDGVARVVLGQYHQNRKIHTANLVGTVDPQGRLVMVGGRTAVTSGATGGVSLTAGEAIVAAAEDVGVEDVSAPEGSATTANREHVFENHIAEGLVDPEPLRAEQVWFIGDSGLSLAWLTEVEAGRNNWFESVVDARSGEVLTAEDRYSHDHGPEGTVFTGQHPDDSPDRQVAQFTGMGRDWVAGTTTAGNNANAYRDLDDSNAVGYQPTAANQHFTYAFTDAWAGLPNGTSLAAPLAAAVQNALDDDLDAIITQLFYYTNDFHDWIYGYGFDEAAGNFQTDNFGLGGTGGDAVLAEAQDGFDFGCEPTPPTVPPTTIRCLDNANFATTATDGSAARMQMYMWANPFRDGSLDGDVIAHEIGHGVNRRNIPNGLNGGAGTQASALNEGSSDVYSFLKWGDAVVGEYDTGNTARGLRSSAYDTHPWTYGNYLPGQNTGHRNGEIWAAAVYQIRERLGLNLTTQLFFDGQGSTGNGPAPTFLDMRDGILAADVASNAGANRCALWAAFASRGMGTDAVSNGLDAVPTEGFDAPADCLPTAQAGGPYNTDEGTDVQVTAGASTPGTHTSAGALDTYEWDFDNDGQFDDATGVNPTFTLVGQDGVYPIHVRVTDTWGLTDEASGSVTVANVAPSVTIDPIPVIDEFETTTISGVISDPGWLDVLSATIDFDDGAGPQPLTGTLENVRPDATLTFSVDKQYGDDGTFTVTVEGFDDDTSTTEQGNAVVANIDPTVVIDGSDMTEYGGESAFMAKVGEPVTVPVDATDPGSDDLHFTWDWGDLTVTHGTSLVNPPALDPLKSPSVQPRDVTRSSSHTYGEACLLELTTTVDDDDGGTASDSAAVVIRGTADKSRPTGWWKNQYDGTPKDFTVAELQCLVDIVSFYSLVFPPGMTVADAGVALHNPPKNDPRTKFDEVAMAVWLNFANGAINFEDPVNANGTKGNGSTVGAVLLNVETVRMNAASTDKQISDARTILNRMS